MTIVTGVSWEFLGNSPEHISSAYGARKLDPITLACIKVYGYDYLVCQRGVTENKNVYAARELDRITLA